MEMIVNNSSLDSTNLLEDFKIRVEEAMGLVARMNAEDTIEAVHYWNSFSERLQQLVYHTAEAAEIEAIEAMALDLEQDSERSSNVTSDSTVLPNGINITTNADPSNIDQDSQSSTVTEKKFFDIQNGVDSLLSNGVLDSPINIEHNIISVIGIEEHVNCNSLEVSVNNNNNNNNNTEESGNNVSCNNCDKNTSNDNDKAVHEKKPPIEKLFSCPKLECNAKFRTKGNLLRHSRSHSGTKPWECSVCLNRFTERKSLKVHMRKHTGERPYRCTVCNKSFAQSGILTSHIAMHMNSKSFGCDQCGRAFRQRSQLKLHLQRHAGIRRFQCSLCEYKFLTKGDLERHQRTHTGERPFNCKLCGKSYTRQQSLKEHINRHFGHKPYSCKHCCKAFAEMSACYKHVKSHKITAEMNTDKSVINNDTSQLIEEKNKSAIELAPLIIVRNDSKQDELISV